MLCSNRSLVNLKSSGSRTSFQLVTAKEFFGWAKRLSQFSVWAFWTVAVLSLVLLVVEDKRVGAVVQAVLIVASIAGIGLSLLTQNLQNRGNRAQRAIQFTNSLGVPIGENARENYFNTDLPPSLARLAATTFENTFFTTTVLCKMLFWERIRVVVYLLLFLFLMAARWLTLPWLLFLAQTLFSSDIALHWLRMECFCSRVARVKDRLHQFFLQAGDVTTPEGLAIVLTAFTDYECAKDEAAMPLDEKTFRKLNPSSSKKWNALRDQLKIDK
jgi:hypothetical protein